MKDLTGVASRLQSCMFEIRKSEAYAKWIDGLRDLKARARAYSTVIRPLIPRTFGHPVHGNPATDSMNIRPAIPR